MFSIILPTSAPTIIICNYISKILSSKRTGVVVGNLFLSGDFLMKFDRSDSEKERLLVQVYFRYRIKVGSCESPFNRYHHMIKKVVYSRKEIANELSLFPLVRSSSARPTAHHTSSQSYQSQTNLQ